MRPFEILGIVLFLALLYVVVAIVFSLVKLRAGAPAAVADTTMSMAVSR